jgi:uncharacterized protein (TIRG00374 family)
LRKQKLQSAVLGGLISLCCVGLLLKRVNLREAWQALANVDPHFLLLPFALFVLNYLVRALRWQMLFPPNVRPGYWLTFRSFAIGTGANNFAPARAGDLARCVLISRDLSLTGSTLALATFAVEKVFDGLTLLAILLLASLSISPPAWLTTLTVTGSLVFGGALLLICTLRSRKQWMIGGVYTLLCRLRLRWVANKASALFSSFSEGLSGTFSASQLLRIAVLTLLIWLTDAGCVWGIAKALGLSLSLPYSIIVTGVIGLGLAVPAAPASVGTYEFFAVAALGLAGIPSASALACALLLHSWSFVTTSGTGFICLAWAGLSPRTCLADANRGIDGPSPEALRQVCPD